MQEEQLFFGRFRFDPTNECLWRGKEEVRLHPKAFLLLRHLLHRRGQMVTKESLLETIWPGVNVGEAVLSVYVAEIRKALGEDAKKPVFIETLHGRGYRFTAPVSVESGIRVSRSAAGGEALRRPIIREAATSMSGKPIIGREKDLSFLQEKLEASLHGTGSVVFITGPAGIGKTRLVRELRHHAARRGCQWFGGKYEKSGNPPYSAWVELLQAYLQQKDGRSLADLKGPHIEHLARFVPDLMPRANNTSTIPRQDAAIERTRLLEAWTRLFIEISSETPLVLFVDDVQWAGSLELVHHLASNIGNHRILILVAYRDDELKTQPSLWKTLLAMNRERLFYPLSLEPLRKEEVGELITQRFEQTISAHLVEAVYGRTGGNPFFVEEVLRLLQERKLLCCTEAGLDLTRSASIEIPESVKVVITERVESLGKDAVELLAKASAIGREFPLQLLQQFAGEKEEQLIAIIDRCEGLNLVQSSQAFGVEKYVFTHDLLQEALYETIGPGRRRRYHRRIGQVIEKLYASHLQKWYEALAYHYRAGTELEKAVIYSHRAGVNAASHFAYGEAVLHFEQALAALEHLPEGRHKLEQGVAIRIDLGPALIAIGSYLAPEVEENYAEARKWCEQLGASRQLFPVLWTLSRIRHWRGELAAAREIAAKLLSLAQRENDSLQLLEAHHTLWAISLDMGELRSAKEHAEQGFTLYDRVRHFEPGSVYGGHDAGVCSRIHAAKTAWLLGYPDEALRRIESALMMATDLAHPYTVWLALTATMWIYYHVGEYQGAEDALEKLLALAREQQHGRWMRAASFLQGWLMVEQNLCERGLEQMRHLQGDVTIEARQQTYYMALMAQACLKSGRSEEAHRGLTRALSEVRDTGACYYEAELHRLQGEVLLSRSAYSQQEAETCFRRAIDLSHAQRAKSLELRAVMSLSALWQKQGKRDEARQMLQAVYSWFTEGFETADLKRSNKLLRTLQDEPGK